MIKIIISRGTLRLAGAAVVGAALGLLFSPSAMKSPTSPEAQVAHLSLPESEEGLKSESEKMLAHDVGADDLNQITPAAGE